MALEARRCLKTGGTLFLKNCDRIAYKFTRKKVAVRFRRERLKAAEQIAKEPNAMKKQRVVRGVPSRKVQGT